MRLKTAISLSLLACLVFAVTYGAAVFAAWPSADRRGFFYNILDNTGTEVWPSDSNTAGCAASGGVALPAYIDTADEFIAFTKCKLVSNNSQSTMYRNSERTGAAFIIQSMIGDRGSKITSVSDSRVAAWEGVVRAYAANGWVTWNYSFTNNQNLNTFYQGCCGGGSDPDDDAAYPNNAGGASIVFSDGSSSYVIRRICANPVGYVSPLRAIWNAIGSTSVTDSIADAGDTATSIKTRPGDTLRFVHRINNNGPSNANMWYSFFGHLNATNFTGQYYNNITLSGAPTLTRSDPGELKFDWGTGSPGAGINADNFSVRWTKTEYFNAGSYNFNVVADDGVRVYVDGALIIDRWIDQAPTFYTATTSLTSGNHTVTMEYYERSSGAVAYLWYNNPVNAGADGGTFIMGVPKDFPENVLVPSDAVPGSQICRRVLWDNKNSTATGDFAPYASWAMGSPACATVVGDYDLVPTISTPGTAYAQEGDTIRFNYFIQNTGIDSGSGQCYVQNESAAPVSVPGLTCSSTQSFPSNTAGPPLAVGGEDFLVPPGTPAGTRICRTLFIQPASPTVSVRPSTQACVNVVKTPYVHFMGGDVWAGGGFADSVGNCTTNQAKITTNSRAIGGTTSYAGSMVEYNAFALGTISGFGSASKALVTGAPAGATALAKALTFSNTQTDPGNFAAPGHCIRDYASDFASVTATCPTTINVAAPGSTPCRLTGNATIDTGTLPAGSKQVYVIDGSVNITGTGINYPASYSNSADIPSLVIIASGDIRVNGSVRNLSGIYITKGNFFTCQEKPPLPTATCNSDLTVNGAIVAKNLDLYRTAGAEGVELSARQSAAEVIKLSPEVFLNNALNTSSSSTIVTSQIRELPPRF